MLFIDKPKVEILQDAVGNSFEKADFGFSSTMLVLLSFVLGFLEGNLLASFILINWFTGPE